MAVKTAECIRSTWEGFGTVNGLCIYGTDRTELLDRVKQRMQDLECKLSVFRPDSEIWALNRSAGKQPVPVSRETFRILAAAKECSALSGGAFAVTVRPLTALWKIGKPGSALPEPEKIGAAKALINDSALILDAAAQTAFLSIPGQGVDLGGIAKGYAADEIRSLLTREGVTSALINLGGNIVAVGAGSDGRPWQIGIQNPASVRGEVLGTVAVVNKTMVTSGRNEHFFLKDGICYHHLMDPRTGRPALSGLLSVTVIGENSMEADALSTAAFVLGLREGMALLNRCRAEAVFATDDYQIFLSRGMVSQFKRKKDLGD